MGEDRPLADDTLLSYQEALDRTLAVATPLPSRTVELADAVGEVVAQPVLAREPSPAGTLSAMDGFALRAADAQQATADRPVRLPLLGVVAAGDSQAQVEALVAGRAQDHTAVRVMTGGLLPPGCDAVVKLEDAQGDDASVTLREPVRAGQHVRHAGEDHQPGDVLVSGGTVVDPPRVLLLANLGCARVDVHRRPRVAVLPTGKELVENLETPLLPGQVYNSCARYVMAGLSAFGAKATGGAPVSDDPAAVCDAVGAAAGAADQPDAIVTTGGVSKGAFDFVPAALQELSAEVLFHGVQIRPGMPVLCARLPDSGTVVFGLPGNPIAVLLTYRLFVEPYLAALQGRRMPPSQAVALQAEVAGRPPLRRYLLARTSRARSWDVPSGAHPLPGQATSKVAPLQQADGWVVVPEDRKKIPAGAQAEFVPLVSP